jgi:hypothetical protein
MSHDVVFAGAECGTAVEQYSDEELGLCVIALATFVHREPAAAAALLPALLHAVSRYPHSNRLMRTVDCG